MALCKYTWYPSFLLQEELDEVLEADQWLRVSAEAHRLSRTFDDPLKLLKQGLVFLLVGTSNGYVAVIDKTSLLPLCSLKVSVPH